MSASEVLTVSVERLKDAAKDVAAITQCIQANAANSNAADTCVMKYLESGSR